MSSFFSIVTVVKNDENYILSTLKSVKSQSFSDYEHIIIDGFSTDKTLQKIEEFDNKKIILISEKDKGIYEAMNKGIYRSCGKFILLLNSGDILLPESLRNVYSFLKSEEYDILSGSIIKGHSINSIKFKIARNYKYFKRNILYNLSLNHPATFVARSVYLNYGTYDESFKICADHAYFFKLSKIKLLRIIFIDEDITFMKLGGVSEKYSSIFTRAKEKYKIHVSANISLVKRMFYFIRFLFVNTLKIPLRNLRY